MSLCRLVTRATFTPGAELELVAGDGRADDHADEPGLDAVLGERGLERAAALLDQRPSTSWAPARSSSVGGGSFHGDAFAAGPSSISSCSVCCSSWSCEVGTVGSACRACDVWAHASPGAMSASWSYTVTVDGGVRLLRLECEQAAGEPTSAVAPAPTRRAVASTDVCVRTITPTRPARTSNVPVAQEPMRFRSGAAASQPMAPPRSPRMRSPHTATRTNAGRPGRAGWRVAFSSSLVDANRATPAAASPRARCSGRRRRARRPRRRWRALPCRRRGTTWRARRRRRGRPA